MIAILLFTCVGCPESGDEGTAPDTADEAQATVAPPKLKLLIVGTPGIAEEIVRQWSARREGELKVTEISAGDFSKDEFRLADRHDVIIYPGTQTGELISRDKLMDIPPDVLNSEQLNKNEILRIHRTSLVQYATLTYGLPFGSPQLMMFCNRAALASTKREFPETWPELRTLIEKGATNSPDRLQLLLPMDERWAGYTYLALVAGRIRNRGSVSTVFDIRTGEPLIQRRPFVQLLEEMRDVVDERSAGADPEFVYRALVQDQAALGVTWASSAFDIGDAETNNRLVVGRVPGSKTWYDFDEDALIPRELRDPHHVDLIGFDSRVVAISGKTGKADAALDFATWLVSKQISRLVVPRSPSGAPFRASHLGEMPLWTGDGIGPAAQEQIAMIFRTTDDESLTMMFPRIPAADQYMDALTAAVRRVVFEQGEAKAELNAVAKTWTELNERLGKKAQIRWMRKSEGLQR